MSAPYVKIDYKLVQLDPALHDMDLLYLGVQVCSPEDEVLFSFSPDSPDTDLAAAKRQFELQGLPLTEDHSVYNYFVLSATSADKRSGTLSNLKY